MCLKAVNTNDNFTTPSSLITKIISGKKAEKLSERKQNKMCRKLSCIFQRERSKWDAMRNCN
jgi:hypothetical protein